MPRIKSKKSIVQNWQKKNPRGGKSQCVRETNLSKKTVYKWWNDDLYESLAYDKKKTGREDKALLIAEWRRNNPDKKNKAECARELGIARGTVIKWWNQDVNEEVIYLDDYCDTEAESDINTDDKEEEPISYDFIYINPDDDIPY